MKHNGLRSSSSILTTSWNYVKAIAACKKERKKKELSHLLKTTEQVPQKQQSCVLLSGSAQKHP